MIWTVVEIRSTIYIEEALYRLVETYYVLGLVNEAEKYAKLLGYNFQSSEWYEKSYTLFDKNYAEKQKKTKKLNQQKSSDSLVEKVKSLFEWDG